jgi:hypothetical protein
MFELACCFAACFGFGFPRIGVCIIMRDVALMSNGQEETKLYTRTKQRSLARREVEEGYPPGLIKAHQMQMIKPMSNCSILYRFRSCLSVSAIQEKM